jgi:hypothetical protein
MLPVDYLEQLKRCYPRRLGDNGWLHVRTLVPRALSAGASWERILAGTQAYAEHCNATGKTGTELVKQAKTFFGPCQYFDEWADMQPIETPKQRAEAARWTGLAARSAAIRFRPPTAMESPDVYETALRLAERECRECTGSLEGSRARDMPNVVSMLARQKAV